VATGDPCARPARKKKQKSKTTPKKVSERNMRVGGERPCRATRARAKMVSTGRIAVGVPTGGGGKIEEERPVPRGRARLKKEGGHVTVQEKQLKEKKGRLQNREGGATAARRCGQKISLIDHTRGTKRWGTHQGGKREKMGSCFRKGRKRPRTGREGYEEPEKAAGTCHLPPSKTKEKRPNRRPRTRRAVNGTVGGFFEVP